MNGVARLALILSLSITRSTLALLLDRRRLVPFLFLFLYLLLRLDIPFALPFQLCLGDLYIPCYLLAFAFFLSDTSSPISHQALDNKRQTFFDFRPGGLGLGLGFLNRWTLGTAVGRHLKNKKKVSVETECV
jgi:hypothetical protein